MPDWSRLLPRMIWSVADAKRGLAAVRAVRTNRADVLHFPRASFIAIRFAGQRADRADVDTSAALIALEVIALIGSDLTHDAAIHDAERVDAHAFIADTNAAVAKNAPGRIEEHDRRKLLFIHVMLHFGEPALAGAVREHHVLQFALAALIADRAIERVIRQQQLEHGFASLHNDGESVRTTMPSPTARVHAV